MDSRDTGCIPDLLAYVYSTPEARREPPCDSRLLPAIRLIGQSDNVELVISLKSQPTYGQTELFRVVASDKLAVEVWLRLDDQYHVFEVYRHDYQEPQSRLAERIQERLTVWRAWQQAKEEAAAMSRGIPDQFRQMMELFTPELRAHEAIGRIARLEDGAIGSNVEAQWSDPPSVIARKRFVEVIVYCDGYQKSYRLTPFALKPDNLVDRVRSVVIDLWTILKERIMPTATHDPQLAWLRRFGQAEIRTIKEGGVEIPNPPTVALRSDHVEVCCDNGKGVSVITVKTRGEHTTVGDLFNLIGASIARGEHPSPGGQRQPASPPGDAPAGNQCSVYRERLSPHQQPCFDHLIKLSGGQATFSVRRLWGEMCDVLTKRGNLSGPEIRSVATAFVTKLRQQGVTSDDPLGRDGQTRLVRVDLTKLPINTTRKRPGSRPPLPPHPEIPPPSGADTQEDPPSIDPPADAIPPSSPDLVCELLPNPARPIAPITVTVNREADLPRSRPEPEQPPIQEAKPEPDTPPRTTEELCGLIHVVVMMLKERGYTRVALSDDGTIQLERELQP